MLTETLAAGLQQYKIGSKIRALRLRKKLALVQLGKHTGLSPAMLSKIERDQMFPTLPTLLRIALVFGVGLEHFFAAASKRKPVAVTRRGERLRLPERAGMGAPPYFFESLDFPATERRLDAFLADFPAKAGASDPHRHDGAELIYVLRGQLAVNVDGAEFVLQPGDSMYFDSGAPHGYRRHGKTGVSALVVVAPKLS